MTAACKRDAGTLSCSLTLRLGDHHAQGIVADPTARICVSVQAVRDVQRRTMRKTGAESADDGVPGTQISGTMNLIMGRSSRGVDRTIVTPPTWRMPAIRMGFPDQQKGENGHELLVRGTPGCIGNWGQVNSAAYDSILSEISLEQSASGSSSHLAAGGAPD